MPIKIKNQSLSEHVREAPWAVCLIPAGKDGAVVLMEANDAASAEKAYRHFLRLAHDAWLKADNIQVLMLTVNGKEVAHKEPVTLAELAAGHLALEVADAALDATMSVKRRDLATTHRTKVLPNGKRVHIAVRETEKSESATSEPAEK